MLDKKCGEVLRVLKKLNAEESYKVVTLEEIAGELKGFSLAVIKQCMDTLAREGYINIKFCEDNTYCYSIKKQISAQQEVAAKPNNKLMYLYIFLAAFAGSFLAFMLVALIF